MLWHKKKDGTPEAEAPVQYAGGVLNSFGSLPQKPSRKAKADAQVTTELEDGTPEGTRTPDPLLRRQLLYPPELQARVERVMGIEPTRPAWKAGILPLNYTRVGRYSCVSLEIIA